MQMPYGFVRLTTSPEVVLGDFQVDFDIAHADGLPKPLERSTVFSFIPPEDADVVRRGGRATAVGALVPVESGLAVTPYALGIVIVISEV